jgi:release factor glutamine methyltransferase
MTIMEALQWANNKLKKIGIDSPMLDAEILLADTLNTSKSWLFSHFNDKLKTHQQEKFHELVDRRVSREPIAYILGKKEFYGREFIVNSFVLIPRPETETMIEHALELLSDSDPNRTLICDIGTGSGAIAETIAAETKLPIIATDIDPQALGVAKQNAKLTNTEENIDFQHGNLAEPLIRIFKTIRGQTDVQTSWEYPFNFLLITANLPYLPESRMESVEPEVSKYEPRIALTSGADGLNAYWELFRQLHSHRDILPRKLIVLIEIDPEQRIPAEKLILHSFPQAKLRTKKDLIGLDRVIEAQI